MYVTLSSTKKFTCKQARLSYRAKLDARPPNPPRQAKIQQQTSLGDLISTLIIFLGITRISIRVCTVTQPKKLPFF